MPSERVTSEADRLPPASRVHRLVALAILLLTLGMSLLLSARKLFWEDELFEFYSDARPSLLAVLHGQRHFPFSLEPPAFHLLLHGMQRLPLRPEIATRLPAAFGLLLLQLCVYSLVLGLTRRRGPALLALALPFALATFDYSAEARVYSLLASVNAAAFVAYRVALSPHPRSRLLGSLALFVTLSAAVLLHYYGLLLPLPFLFSETLRLKTLRLTRWRVDWPILAAITGSVAIFAANLPFLAGVREVQAIYFDSGEARWDMVPLSYLWILLRGKIYHLRLSANPHPGLFAAAFLCTLALGLWLLRRLTASTAVRPGSPRHALLLALAAGLLIPLLNVTIGVLHSHAYSPRYSLPVAIPLIVLGVTALAPALCRPFSSASAVLLVLAAGIYQNLHLLREAKDAGSYLRRRLTDSSALVAASTNVVDQHLYVQDLTSFMTDTFYAPPGSKSRIVNLQSVPLELKWFHSGAASLFSRYMGASTPLPVTTFEQLATRRGPHLLLLYGTSSEWISSELRADHIQAEPLGDALGGHLFQVTFIPWPVRRFLALPRRHLKVSATAVNPALPSPGSIFANYNNDTHGRRSKRPSLDPARPTIAARRLW